MIPSNQLNKVLLGILEENQYTEYGKRYHFDYFRTVDGYRSVVPLVNPEDVKPLIELTTRIGEQRIYTRDPLIAYTLTSGTAETNNYVPCTAQHIKPYVDEFVKLLTSEHGDNVVLFESIPRKIIYSDRAKLDTVTGIMLQQIRKNIGKYNITSPEELLFREDPADTIYYRTLFALSSENVVQIIAPFTWSVMALVNCILDCQDQLVHDIETGEITFNEYISEDLKGKLQSVFRANPQRASMLKEVFNKVDYKTGLLEKVWPKLKKVTAAGTGSFSIYTDNLKKYLGDVKFSNGFYASSEAIIGQYVRNDVYKLYDGNVYIEFLPLGSDKTVLYDEVELGKQYVVYITNHAGLYRYCMSDVVEITDVKSGIPYFRYVSRLEEKIPERLVYAGIKKCAEKTGVEISDYCYCKNIDGGLTIYLESRQGAKLMEMKEELVSCFDESLKVEDVQCLKFGVQQKYKRMRALGGNMAADQLKPIRLLEDEDQKSFFMF